MVHANIEIINAADLELADRMQIGEEEIRRIEISCLVDSGAVMLTINEDIRELWGCASKITARRN
ncbi:MAG: hypothetical protein IPJ82_18585 [Lewinellaceae bacterium]|nr:hypothetical protein [Lewinellaceae bacterium]